MDPNTFKALSDIAESYLIDLIVKINKRANRKTNGTCKIEKNDILYFVKDNPKIVGKVSRNIMFHNYILKDMKKTCNNKVIDIAKSKSRGSKKKS